MTGLYAGATALAIGNSVKAGVRFMSYDYFRTALRDSEVTDRSARSAQRLIEQGKLSAPRSILAGLLAGVAEAVIAVTPSETIKWVEVFLRFYIVTLRSWEILSYGLRTGPR